MRLKRMHLSPLLLLFFLRTTAHSQDHLDLNGYITRVASPTDFDVDGVHVLLAPTTRMDSVDGAAHKAITVPTPYLGQFAKVQGKFDGKAFTIASKTVSFYEPQSTVLNGSGVIDLVFPDTGNARRIRADGRILQTSLAVLEHPVPMPRGGQVRASPQDLRPDVWIDYHGKLRPDGVVEVDRADFSDNLVEKAEATLIEHKEYDPAAIPGASHQSSLSKAFIGIDPRQIPPYQDASLQARVNRIAATLIPACQRALPDDDPARIHFRFHLVDEPKWRDALALPSGIILIPHQIVRRLPDDAQLAAILADNIATTFEKQDYRQQHAVHTIKAANIAGMAAGIVVPGAEIGTAIALASVAHSMLTHAEEQSGRVALTLMHDAGYDLTRAPEAWWILATPEGKSPHGTRPPPRAVNQYFQLGTTWRNADAKPSEHPAS